MIQLYRSDLTQEFGGDGLYLYEDRISILL